MPTEDLRERLLQAARERAHPSGGRPPAPGDLFVLAATGDLPVEWAILDRRPDGKVLAVPGDTNPLAGSADVEVPATASGGPLSLRCRFAAWLDAGRFEPGMRSGELAPGTIAEARQRVHQVESGTLEPSPLAEETDAESEYRDWIREVPERARALALAARPPVRAARGALWEGYRLAATFALLAIGLGIWVAVLRRQVDQLSAPIFDFPAQEVVLGEKTRGSTVLPVTPEASHVLLDLVVDSSIPGQEGRFELLDTTGRVVWSKHARLIANRDYRLILDRSRIADGVYSIRIVGADGHILAESTLAVKTAP